MALEHDAVVVTNRVSDVHEAVGALTELARMPLDAYTGDPHKVASPRYGTI